MRLCSIGLNGRDISIVQRGGRRVSSVDSWRRDHYVHRIGNHTPSSVTGITCPSYTSLASRTVYVVQPLPYSPCYLPLSAPILFLGGLFPESARSTPSFGECFGRPFRGVEAKSCSCL